jgi:hypothetical protein
MTFMTRMKPPQGTSGRRVGKRWYKILNPPEDTPLDNDAK